MNSTANPHLIQQTMAIMAEAYSHFDPSVSGPVEFQESPVAEVPVDVFWTRKVGMCASYLTEKWSCSRYGEKPQFSPEWLNHLSDDDHEKIAAFIKSHRESFWAVDGLIYALLHQCLSSKPDYAYTLRNFMLLWDDTTSHTIEVSTQDCYSLHAISGLGGVDVSSLPVKEQAKYRALAGFAVDAYLSRFFGSFHMQPNSEVPLCVNEHIYPGNYEVEEPYRSLVFSYPEQAEAMIEYLKRGYRGQELEDLLAKGIPATVSMGVL